jgi:heme-degrading monooxygenase HmoA
MEGFEGPYLLFDRDSGKGFMVGLWESEEALVAVQHTGNTQTIEARGVSVGKYEVVLSPEAGVRQEDSQYSEQPLAASG